MQSVPITTNLAISNPTQAKQHYVIKLSVTYDRSVVSSTNKTDRHDITEILFKVALNAIIQPNQKTVLRYCPYIP